jgi:uncharacterized protein YdaU (DUF1376 family)
MSLPSMMFYPGDYLRDTGHLSTEEHGAYLLLLWHAWTQSGVLPADDEMLRRITRLAPKTWARSRGVVLAFFTRQADGYHQNRMDKEIAKARAMVAKKRDAVDRTQRWRSDKSSPKEGDTKPPNGHNVMHNSRITDAQQERHREHNVIDVPQSQPVPTLQGEGKELINKNPLPIKDLVGSHARESDDLRASDNVEALHRIERRDDEKLSANPAVEAHIRRAAQACKMHTDYGSVHSPQVQMAAATAQPVVDLDASGYRWGPADPVRSPAQQMAELLGISLAEAERRVPEVAT